MKEQNLHRYQYEFPDPSFANEDGLLAIGGDLNPHRLIAAYEKGIFPWFSQEQPILWWCPDPRFILRPHELEVTKSTRQYLRSRKYEVRFDTRFKEVINHCATIRRKDQDDTWITSEMESAYCELHEMGFAHSVETWFENKLIGGLYGVSLGNCFFGESMFSLEPNASKAALIGLTQRLLGWKFSLIDCQIHSDHLESLGASFISRDDFLKEVDAGLQHSTRKGKWTTLS